MDGTTGNAYLVVGAILLGLYVAFVILFDRCFSALASWRSVGETLRGLKGCRGLPAPPHGSLLRARFDEVSSTVDDLVDDALSRLGADRPAQPHRPFLVDATVVLSTWRSAHDLDRLCWGVAPRDQAAAHLGTVGAELAAYSTDKAKKMVARINAFAHTPKADPWPLLDEALEVYYDQRDTFYESLANRQTTGSWMAILGAGLVVLLAVALHHEVLMLFGAAGGFLSRTQRLLSRRPSSVDYGVSAVIFLLAPVVGALSGWAGAALLEGLVQLKILDKATFGSIWTHPMRPAAYVVAFAFGFVERLTDRAAGLVAAAIPAKGGSE